MNNLNPTVLKDSSPLPAQYITAQEEEEKEEKNESELLSLHSLLGLNSPYHHFDFKDTLNKKSIIELILSIKELAKVLRLTNISI